MPIISAVGLFCYYKFEETPNEKVVNMSKLTKSYFRQFASLNSKCTKITILLNASNESRNVKLRWLAILLFITIPFPVFSAIYIYQRPCLMFIMCTIALNANLTLS